MLPQAPLIQAPQWEKQSLLFMARWTLAVFPSTNGPRQNLRDSFISMSFLI